MPGSRDFGKIINERRLSLGYSLGQLATRMGTTATKVRSWERGDAVPDDATIEQLADELNLDIGVIRATLPGAAASPDDSESEEATAVVADPVFSDATDTTGVADDLEEDAAAVVADVDEAAEEGAASADDAEEPSDAAAEPLDDPEEEEDATALVVAGAGEVADDAAAVSDDEVEPPDVEGAELLDLPTEAVPLVPPAAAEPAAGLVAAPAMVAARPSAPVRVDPNDLGVPESSGLFAPVEQFMRTIFDPDKPYLFWIRVALIGIVFLVFLRILAWAVPEFFDVLKDILDTIESTPIEPEPGTDLIDG